MGGGGVISIEAKFKMKVKYCSCHIVIRMWDIDSEYWGETQGMLGSIGSVRKIGKVKNVMGRRKCGVEIN